jgi:NADPH:quinone reductase-like Zn-dependent oxidoreductase
MRQALYDRYGSLEVVRIADVPDPRPAPGELLVRVRACALNPKDVLVRKGKFPWLAGRRFPKAMGYDFAGEVERGAGDFRPGDRVFGMIQSWRAGAVAERCTIPLDQCAHAPEGLSFEQAAALPLASLTALQALRDEASLGPGQRVLLHGASGGVGVYAIQIAKATGAHVTTTSSAKNLEFCGSLGADVTLDYAVDDGLSGKRAFDVFFDVFGNRSLARVAPILSPRGTYVSTVPSPRVLFDQARTSFAVKKARLVVVRSRRRDLEAIAALVSQGKLSAVVDKVYSLDEIGPAQAHIESKRARGKVVVAL